MAKAVTKAVAVYTRVSTAGQNDRAQVHELRQYIAAHGLTGVKWYRDKATGATLDRPEFARLQADIFGGQVGTVIVWKLDRLSRSLRDGVALLADLCERGIRVVSVTQQISLDGVIGRMISALLWGCSEMERENINERIRAGLASARERGVRLGRPKGPGKRKVDAATVQALKGQGKGMTEIARILGVSKPTVYAAVRVAAVA